MRKKNPARPNRPHFDLPIKSEAAIQKLVSNPEKVRSHSFYPFLHFELTSRRYRRDPNDKNARIIDTKVRPIRIAAHRDTYIFHHYNNQLSQLYETAIAASEVDQCVLAYRKGKGSNIDFANEAFEKITELGACGVIAADLKSFYESIDHDLLYRSWSDLLGEAHLPPDHLAVFRAVTKYSYVSVSDLKSALSLKKKDKFPKPIFPNMKQYREVLRGKDGNGENLIRRNTLPHGIPQGSPISALLSNIVMKEFDFAMAMGIKKLGGYYRRYSDDILQIVPWHLYSSASELLSNALQKLPGQLRENEEKRVVSFFDENGSLVTGEINLDGITVQSRVLQYLGFLYDGSQVTVRSQTLARYWRKATRGIRAAKRRALKNKLNPKLYKRKLYRRFSHLGKTNLYTYKRNSENTMSFDGIRRQFSRQWRQLQKEISGPIKAKKRPSRNKVKKL